MKTAVVTGASRGIGAGIAQAFANAGYRVVLNYFSHRAEAEALQNEIRKRGGEAYSIGADVSDLMQAERLIAEAAKFTGKIDVLVNNAGIGESRLFTEVSYSEYRRMTDVNLGGTFFCSQAAARLMIGQNAGSIVNVSSVWGVAGASCECLYSATKGAVIALTKAMAKELGPAGIRVNCVCPGVIETDMTAPLSRETKERLAGDTPLNRLGTPEDVAGICVFLADGAASFITGQVIQADGGFL